MARFYQPRSTKGVYDRSANRLTVNCGDPVVIGFSVDSKKEEDEITVDASEADALRGRYRVSNLAVELEIDTSRPRRFTLEATRTGFMEPSRAVLRPLEVLVHFRHFRSVSAQGQWNDTTGCWAACLSWWLGALLVTDGSRLPMMYNDLLMAFHGMWNRDGTINLGAFQAGVRRNNGWFHMHTETVHPSALPSYLGNWPLVLGFRHPAGGQGHMNVLYGYGQHRDHVQVMEPWFPDTDKISYTDGFPYLTDPNFRFAGAHLERPLSDCTKPAPGTGALLVGYPEEYLHRMP